MGSETSEERKTEQKEIRQTPNEYICPLSNKIMANPIMIPMTGLVYDKITLTSWFKQYSCDPMTGIELKTAKKQNKIILNPRKDIKNKIKLYLELYPHKKKDQIMRNCDINWTQIFEKRINALKQQQDKFRTQDILIKYKSYPLFQQNESHIERNELFTRDNVPIITFMGPNRRGKSTLLNDMMGTGKNKIFKTSHDPMRSCTKGAYIAQYIQNDPCLSVRHYLNEIVGLPQYFVYFIQAGFDDMQKISKMTQHDLIKMGITNQEHQIKLITNQLLELNGIQEEGKSEMKSEEKKENNHTSNGMYLIDVEGSSHQVTEFTTKMFYAVYAISNVIVWNDVAIADDAFVNLMKKIQKNMKSVAESPRKPKFVYLKRDHSKNFPVGNYDNLNDYIQKDEAWKWFHDMNLFRSIHGYQIESRPSQNIPFPKDTLNKLKSFLLDLTPNSQRFVQNNYELNKQLSLINKIGRIDSGMEKIYKDFTLYGLLFDEDEIVKCGQILKYAEYFKWDVKRVEKAFKKADSEILEKMVNENLIEEDIRITLMVNKDIVIQRIVKMNETDREDFHISPEAIAAIGFITLAVMAIGGFGVIAR